MLRNLLRQRLQLLGAAQQSINSQWVPTVEEVCCSYGPSSLSQQAGLDTDSTGIDDYFQRAAHLRVQDHQPCRLPHDTASDCQRPACTCSMGCCLAPSHAGQDHQDYPDPCAAPNTVHHRGYHSSTTMQGMAPLSNSSFEHQHQDPHAIAAAATRAGEDLYTRASTPGSCLPTSRPSAAASDPSGSRRRLFQQQATATTDMYQQQHTHSCMYQQPNTSDTCFETAASSSSQSKDNSGSPSTDNHGSEQQEQQEDDSTAHSHRKRSKKQRREQQQQHTDMRCPASWYPLARAMQRQLIAHVGPTNSGKTHAALSALMAAGSGVYCGPLRLLACEIADRLNAAGVPCNLVTGQEVRLVQGARHTACTVEMADLDQRVEVAVLDEIQMISDKARGWSWTRALLGLPARSVHLCGDPAATDLIEKLASHCNDTFTVNRYRRLSPLIVEPRALEGISEVQEGDCLVAFGRKTLHKLRRSILAIGKGSEQDVSEMSESGTESGSESGDCSSKHMVGMVYGALPPEARRTQAALFNAGADEWPRYSVMVASDAIGMGLNLNIRRVVFASMHKYDGAELRRLTPSEVKQIAGRAGRYGSTHGAAGYVTCLNEDDLPLLREALGTASTQNTEACLLPRYEQLEQYSSSFKRPLPFHKLLSKFSAAANLSGPYFLADMSNMVSLARALTHLENDMDLEEMYTWCISPAGAGDPAVLQALLTFATLYVRDSKISPDCITTEITTPPRTPAEMKSAEELCRVYELYLWLAGRVGPGVFRGRKLIRQQRQNLADLINTALQEMGGVPGGGVWGSAAADRAARAAAAAARGVREDGRGVRGAAESVRSSLSSSEDDEAEVVGV